MPTAVPLKFPNLSPAFRLVDDAEQRNVGVGELMTKLTYGGCFFAKQAKASAKGYSLTAYAPDEHVIYRGVTPIGLMPALRAMERQSNGRVRVVGPRQYLAADRHTLIEDAQPTVMLTGALY